MAKKSAPKKGDKGKGAPVKKEGKKLGNLYTISGDKIEKKNRSCPKCGPGMFLGKHKNRIVCGKCQYVEFMSDKKETVAEEDNKKETDTPAEEK
jgi:ubiquitin-small subunit ribosomal protein S27Ae